MANQPDIRVRLSAEGVQEVVGALKTVQAQAKLLQASGANLNTSLSLDDATGGILEATDSVLGLTEAFGGLAAAAASYLAVSAVIARGLDENESAERSIQAAAAILVSQGKILDSQGKLLSGQEAYAQATVLAQGYMDGLAEKISGTALDLGTLQAASKGILFAGINNGVKDLDALQTLTVNVANAMQTLGQSVDGVEAEVTALLAGKKNGISASLGIKPETLLSWKAQGKLVEEVNKRLNSLTGANKKFGESFAGLKQRASSAFGDFSTVATSGLFDRLKSTISGLLDGLYDKTGQLRPEVVAVAEAVGTAFRGAGIAIQKVVDLTTSGMRAVGDFLVKNSALAASVSTGVKDAFDSINRTISSIASGVGKVSGGLNLAAGAVGAVSLAFEGVSIIVSTVVGFVTALSGRILELGASAASVGERLGVLSQGTSSSLASMSQALMNKSALEVKAIELAAKNARAALKSVADAGRDAQAAVPKVEEKPKDGSGSFGGGLYKLGAEELAAKAGDAMRAAADRELALLRAKMAFASNVYSDSYKQNLTDLESYNAARLAIVQAEVDAELEAAQKRIDAAKAMPGALPEDQFKKSQAIAQAENDLAVKRIESEMKLAQARAQNRDELKQLGEEFDKYTRQTLEQTGQREEAANAELELEIKKYDELLVRMGKTQEARDKETAAMRARGQGRNAFDELQRKSQSTNDSFDIQREGVQSKLDRGLLWPAEAEQELLKIERDRVAELEKTAALMTEAAKKSGDQGLIDQANKNTMAVQRMKDATDEYGKAVKTLKEGIQSSVTEGLNTMLDSIIEGTASAKDAVRAFAYDVVTSIRKIAQEMLVQRAITSFFSAFGGGVGGFSTGGVVKAATGGHIRGPGTGTSDSIPAWLSNNEFVVRAAVVQQPGVLDMLQQLNRGGRMPAMRAHNVRSASKFADGGLVGSMAEARSGGTSKVEIGLEDGLVLRSLQTNAGQLAVVKALGAKKRAARQMGV